MKISPKVPSVDFVPMYDKMNDLKTRDYVNEKLLAFDCHIPGWNIPKEISLMPVREKKGYSLWGAVLGILL